MENKEKPAEAAGADREGANPGALGILLNAPSIVSNLVSTALLLSLVTGVVYLWGGAYYAGFIRGLGLNTYNFAFNIPANEVLLGGTAVVSYYVVGLPFAYWSVGIALMAVMIILGLVQLVLVPALARLARAVGPLLARLWGFTGARLLNLRPFRWLLNLMPLRWLRKAFTRPEPKKPAEAAYERALAWLAGSIELYIAHALVSTLLLLLFLWGLDQSWRLGLKDAQTQLKNSPQVLIVFGENEKMESALCARIGGDYILKSQDPQVKYEIIKEATVKRITIIEPSPPPEKPLTGVEDIMRIFVCLHRHSAGSKRRSQVMNRSQISKA